MWFDERDAAAAFAAAVGGDAQPVWFAGEEDSEDAAWIVRVATVNEALIEHHGGWLPADAPLSPATPLDLPSAPQRLKNRPHSEPGQRR